MRLLLVLLLILPTSGFAQIPAAEAVTGGRGMVVSDSEPAAKVGIEILRRGGNAVDAAVATAFAMAVTYPEAGNIGGGGFMMIHPGNDRPVVCVDYREIAPAAAHPTMFELGESRLNQKIAGVPGTVRGLALAHEKYGSLPWKQLVTPAIQLAKEGFEINRRVALGLNAALTGLPEELAEFERVFSPPEGSSWREGDRLVQPDLAQTLKLIAEQGPQAFYQGKIAEQIVAEMQAGNGIITLKDLKNYQAKLREPVQGTYRGYTIYGAQLPSSGGIVTVETLNILENFDLKSAGRFSTKTLHLLIESMKRAYCDRARYLGDRDFLEIPAKLTSKEYAKQLAEGISLDKVTPSEKLAPEIELAGEGNSTTHFSVIDANGMAVANTYTLEYSYGSRVVVRGAGFILNNEMGDFNWKPGHTDQRGNIGTPANRIAPGKRMLSSQSPTIVTKDGKLRLLTGSPGGRTIINTVICMIVNLVDFEMSPTESMQAPRLHHQWLPDLVRFEGIHRPKYQETIEQLKEKGHKFSRLVRQQGSANSIWIDPESGKRTGVGDPRRDGFAAAE